MRTESKVKEPVIRRPITPEDRERGGRIKQARETAGLSQRGLAVHIGVTAGAVGQWEWGMSRPSEGSLLELSQVLDVSIDWILTGRTHDKNKEVILHVLDRMDPGQVAAMAASLQAAFPPRRRAA